MCGKRSLVSILLPVALILGVGVIIGCYFWTRANGDLHEQGGYPYISDLGNRAPQQWLFAFGFGVLACYMVWASTFRYLQFQWQLGKADIHGNNINAAMISLAAIGYLGMIMLAALNDIDYRTAHNVFAVLCFGCLFAYQVMHTALVIYIHDQRHHFRALLDGLEEPVNEVGSMRLYQTSDGAMIRGYLTINLLSLAALIIGSSHYLPIDFGLPQIAESVLVLSTMVYYIPWFWELQNATFTNVNREYGKTNVETIAMPQMAAVASLRSTTKSAP